MVTYFEAEDVLDDTGVTGLASALGTDSDFPSDGSCFIFLVKGEELRGEACNFLFLSSVVGVVERGTGDLPLSFLEPVMRKAFVNSSSLRSGSSESLSELLELASDSAKHTI